jgi:hypothetical protein
MSREYRLIVILVAIAAAGVTGLSIVANQYKEALERAKIEDASSRAARLVDGYLAARRAAKAVVARYPGAGAELPADGENAYRKERFDAFSAHGMTFEDYAVVRTAWRTYRRGGPVSDPALVAAFEARRGDLDEASLGPVESLDDTIR